MNYNISSLQQSSELLYEIYSPASTSNPDHHQQQQTTIQHNQDIIPQVSCTSIITPFSFGSCCSVDNNQLLINLLDKYNMMNNINDQDQTSSLLNNELNTKEKIMIKRRDVERQRRQEMTNLYALLRSLLPIEYIKGKRSISDHMNEAAKYIKNLQKKIQELTEKRDGLKRLMNPTTNDINISRGLTRLFSDHQEPDNYVTVRQCWPGLEVVISNSLSHGGLALSRVFAVLLEEGLDVVSCLSGVNEERSVHTIHSEVISDPTRINVTELQQKLTDVVRYSSRIPMIAGTSTSSTSYTTMS